MPTYALTDADDSIVGTDGDDLFQGVGRGDITGIDTVDGAAGDDVFEVILFNGAEIAGGDGVDTIKVSAVVPDLRPLTFESIEVLDLEYQNYVMTFEQVASVQTLMSSSAPNTVINFALQGPSVPLDFTDKLGAGHALLMDASSLSGGPASPLVVRGSQADDQIGGSFVDDSIAGGLGNDSLNGSKGSDLVSGEDGDDLIAVGLDLYFNADDRDTLLGGNGDDTFTLFQWHSEVGGSAVIDGGAGWDRLELSGTANLVGASLSLTDVEELHLVNGNLTTTLAQLSVLPQVVATDVPMISLILEGAGGSADLAHWGTSGRAVDVNATASTSVISLQTGAGDDTMRGSAFADTLAGGSGNDSYFLQRGDVVIEETGAGRDIVYADFSLSLGDNIEVVVLEGELNRFATGNNLDNVIAGNSGNNILAGKSGNDTLEGVWGDDVLWGGVGDDFLIGGDGRDVMHGGVGNDWLMIVDAGDSAFGGDGDDIIDFSAYQDIGGSDVPVIRGGRGVDTLTLGVIQDVTAFQWAGIEVLDVEAATPVRIATAQLRSLQGIVSTSNPGGTHTFMTDGGRVDFGRLLAAGDSVYAIAPGEAVHFIGGGGINDIFVGSEYGDTLIGGGGIDAIYGNGGNDIAHGGDGDDLILENGTGTGDDSFTGGAGNDILYGGDGNDTLLGGDGADVIDEGAAHNASGDDSLSGGAGNDTIFGGLGNDSISGGGGADALHGGDGNDTYVVMGADTLVELADAGTDTVITAGPAARLGANLEWLIHSSAVDFKGAGNAHDNLIEGNAGNDTLEGWAGSDTIRGEAGDDVLNGGKGHDVLTGGAGRDVFVLAHTGDAVHADTVIDFPAEHDVFRLSARAIPGGQPGALSSDMFSVGAEATTAGACVLHNPLTGEISIDADGAGSGSATVVALITPNLVLSSECFVLA